MECIKIKGTFVYPTMFYIKCIINNITGKAYFIIEVITKFESEETYPAYS